MHSTNPVLSRPEAFQRQGASDANGQQHYGQAPYTQAPYGQPFGQPRFTRACAAQDHGKLWRSCWIFD